MTLIFSTSRVPGGTRLLTPKRNGFLYRTTRGSRKSLWKQRVIAIDGEGWGEDQIGRQQYKLFVAADDEGWHDYLYAEDGRLTTGELLKWIFNLPDGFLTGYGFTYDIAMILLDWQLPRLEALRFRHLRPVLQSDSRWRENYVQWRGWWIDWYPNKRFIIRRNNKTRVVWDAFTWYQTSFVNAVGRSKLATEEELAVIIEGKARRGLQSHSLEEELKYAVMECRLLARLQKHLFTTHDEVGLPLTLFDGPGSTASKALNLHDIKEHKLPLSPMIEEVARKSYVGGRFEVTYHGRFEKLYEYDVVSAYPAAICNLPCLAHGRWAGWVPTRKAPMPPVVQHQLLHVRWHIDPLQTGLWGPFPIRVSELPVWPFTGHAWVWREEFEAASWMTGSFEILEAWSWMQECDHRPFQFVNDYFRQRQIWKAADDGREKVYKLVLNSLYGKLCQQVGKPPFHSWVWASLITAGCRAQLLHGISLDPSAVVMLATDALYSTRELPLIVSNELGFWERHELSDVLVVQPGFYHAKEKTRARGIPDRYVDWQQFEAVWEGIPSRITAGDFDMKGWAGTVVIPRFIGIKKGVYDGKPGMIGRWTEEAAQYAFWSRKRPRQAWDSATNRIVTWPADYMREGFELQLYDPAIYSGERELEFESENHDADEWTYED